MLYYCFFQYTIQVGLRNFKEIKKKTVLSKLLKSTQLKCHLKNKDARSFFILKTDPIKGYVEDWETYLQYCWFRSTSETDGDKTIGVTYEFKATTLQKR